MADWARAACGQIVGLTLADVGDWVWLMRVTYSEGSQESNNWNWISESCQTIPNGKLSHKKSIPFLHLITEDHHLRHLIECFWAPTPEVLFKLPCVNHSFGFQELQIMGSFLRVLLPPLCFTSGPYLCIFAIIIFFVLVSYPRPSHRHSPAISSNQITHQPQEALNCPLSWHFVEIHVF